MATNLRVFNTLAEYEAEKQALTLVCPNVSLIKKPEQVLYLHSNPPLGVGIAALVNGVREFYTPAQWQSLETKPTVLGVYVRTPDTGFIIHPTASSSQKWSNNTTYVIPGVTTATSQATALLDFHGKENTEAVLAALDNEDIADAPAFTWLRGLTGASAFADGSTPFLWSAGQLEICRANANEVNGALALVSGTQINFGTNIWSSTQYSANLSWYWTSTKWNGNFKRNSIGGRALCEI